MRFLQAAVAAALVSVGSAGAAPSAHTFPKLLVRDEGSTVTVEIAHDDLDDPTASLTLYVPAGYDVALEQQPGTTIGAARGLVTAPDLRLARIVVSGTLTTRADRSTVSHGGETVALGELAERCTGKRSHSAFWVLTLRGSGQTLELPLIVDGPSADARFAAATIRACLPPPDVPAGSAGRAPLGFELARMSISLRDVFRNRRQGERRWRLVETEYVRGLGVVNPSDRSEAQALVHAGGSILLRRPVVTLRDGVATVALRGRGSLPSNEEPRYRLYRGAARGSLRAALPLAIDDRAFAATVRVPRTSRPLTIYLQVRAAIETLGLGSSYCRPTFRAEGVPCVYATRMGAAARSAVRRVVIPPRS